MKSHAHILSVDVEDYFQVEAFADVIDRKEWNSYESRVEANTRRLLDLFDRQSAQATFFMLGWVASRKPQLVREILACGHEIACHSFWHRPIYQLKPEVFRQDTRDALHAIEDAGGTEVLGYRAPTWSITKQSLWALEVLAEEGFRYDSSIFPIHHDLYGVPGARREPYVIRTNAGPLLEVPPATLRVAGAVLPAAGGGYLRTFPYLYTRCAIEQLEQQGQAAIIYLHPWEIDPAQPRIAAKLRSRFRHYACLRAMQPKLERLLRTYRFTSFARRWQMISVTSPSVSLLDSSRAQPQLA